MKTIAILLICFTVSMMADGTITRVEVTTPDNSLPVTTLPIRPVRPVHPIVRPTVVYQDNYYNTEYNNCTQYMETITQKDEEILALKVELEALKRKEQERLQETLKADHEAQMKAYEMRKSSVKSKNSIQISTDPVK